MSTSNARPDDAAPVILSLGANLGLREVSVLRALREVERSGAGVIRAISSLYETRPVGVAPMPSFVNCVAQLEPLLCPDDLLERLQVVEGEMGRKGGHDAPREIDIDLVAYSRTLRRSPELTLPHPRYRNRAFVLVPLREIAPRFVCPDTGACIDDLIARLPAGECDGVVRISSRSLWTMGEA